MIEPALTAEEWVELEPLGARAYFQATSDLPPRLRELALGFDQARAMAVANAALPDDDPRKLKAADVEALRRVVDLIAWDDLISVRYDSGEVFADEIREGATTAIQKLAALLPPDDVPRGTG
jgi:hypothetical protein